MRKPQILVGGGSVERPNPNRETRMTQRRLQPCTPAFMLDILIRAGSGYRGTQYKTCQGLRSGIGRGRNIGIWSESLGSNLGGEIGRGRDMFCLAASRIVDESFLSTRDDVYTANLGADMQVLRLGNGEPEVTNEMTESNDATRLARMPTLDGSVRRPRRPG